MSIKAKAYTSALGASLLWASTAAVAKLLLSSLGSIQVLFFSNLFAALSLFGVVCATGRGHLIKQIRLGTLFRFAWMGFIGVFLYYLFLYFAIDLLPAQEAFIINYLWPIMVVLFSVPVLRESLTSRKILALSVSLLGIIVIATQGNFSQLQFNNPLGVTLAVLAAIAYGMFSALGKKYNDDRFLSMAFYYCFAFLYSSIALFMFSEIPTLSFGQLGGLLWAGVFTNGLAFLLWFLALKWGNTAKMSNIAFLTPFLSLVYIYALLNEAILFSSVLGLLLILAGIAIQETRSSKKKQG